MMFMRRMLIENKDLTDVTWFHPGGSARVFFQPAHMADLGEYLRDLPEKTQVEVLGGGSNTCFGSGCFDGVLVYLGARFGGFEALSDHTVRVGAGALTGDVVKKAVLHGLDLTFLGAVPGTIGGAIASKTPCRNLNKKRAAINERPDLPSMRFKTPHVKGEGGKARACRRS